MNVLYEGAILDILRCGGISRYFAELVNRLPSDVTPTMVGPVGRYNEFSHPLFQYHAVKTRPPLKFFRRFWHPMQHAGIASVMENASSDVVHWTYYQGLCRRPIHRSKSPLVITVYDFIHEAFPETDRSGRTLEMKARAIEIADHICCISQTTYDELCQRFPKAANRASVTPLGSGLNNVASATLPNELSGRPYLLFVGRREGYKNFDLLWQAWNQVKHSVPEMQLAIVGPPMKSRERTRLNWRADESRVRFYVNADDSLLRTLYANCAAFVFPSKMEGFGLPILEAMSNGATVLSSTCSALTEVAGDAGYYFDPSDSDTLADLIVSVGKELLADRKEKIRIGEKRVEYFSWHKTAEMTMEVYRSLSPCRIQRHAA